MSRDDFDIESLAKYLHLMPNQVQRMAERGTVPGRRIGGEWRFSLAEIHHWLEDRIGAADEEDLQNVEGVLNRQAREAQSSVRIAEMLSPAGIALPLEARTKASVISDMCELAASTGFLWDPEKMAEAVKMRESLHPTAMESGVALLHPRRPLPHILAQPFIALGRTYQGIPFGAEGGQLTDLFFLICSVDDAGHLRTLARLSRLLGSPGFMEALRFSETPADLIAEVGRLEILLPDL
ncbi:PTS system fructose-specific EIIABC component [Anatilimnocola aggregata]|uniref:PTS system fructose-specific EIIABC component n=1 Tax=Anatilimnocola aggregata TaxID=2528021 RepID=A0A517YCJ4_9BACT|nr:PTS sugar transporter subunit IIA [Anatilimnocola aggregata]QDU27965.1 PTS system fructose-specific EIIABC component [Anatilimnocola aggregata]